MGSSVFGNSFTGKDQSKEEEENEDLSNSFGSSTSLGFY